MARQGKRDEDGGDGEKFHVDGEKRGERKDVSDRNSPSRPKMGLTSR
jgi:hypothetical protein